MTEQLRAQMRRLSPHQKTGKNSSAATITTRQEDLGRATLRSTEKCTLFPKQQNRQTLRIFKELAHKIEYF